MALLHNLKALTDVHLSFQTHLCPLLTFQLPWALLDHVAQSTEELGSVVESSFVLDPLKTSRFLGYVVRGLERHSQMRDTLAPKSKETC